MTSNPRSFAKTLARHMEPAFQRIKRDARAIGIEGIEIEITNWAISRHLQEVDMVTGWRPWTETAAETDRLRENVNKMALVERWGGGSEALWATRKIRREFEAALSKHSAALAA